MKISLFNSFVLAAAALITITSALGAIDEKQFVRVFISSLTNQTSQKCAISDIYANAHEIVKIETPIEIPFVPVKKYLAAYVANKAYTPAEALRVQTAHGLYRLWSSESGIMFARDPREARASIDAWKAKKIMENSKQTYGNAKKVYASMLLNIFKNKLKCSLNAQQ